MTCKPLNRIMLLHTLLVFLYRQFFCLFQSLHECATSSTPDFDDAIHQIETVTLVITALAVFSKPLILVTHIALFFSLFLLSMRHFDPSVFGAKLFQCSGFRCSKSAVVTELRKLNTTFGKA